MLDAEVSLNTTGLDQLLSSSEGPVAQYLRNIANRIETVAKRLCPVGETGELRDSIHVRQITIDGNVNFYIGSDLYYAYFVHEGVPESDPGGYIYAINYPVMTFEWHGETAHFAKVHGHRANRFLSNALDEVLGT